MRSTITKQVNYQAFWLINAGDLYKNCLVVLRGLNKLKGDKIIGFKETNEIIEKIDFNATQKGLDRSGYLRMIIRKILAENVET